MKIKCLTAIFLGLSMLPVAWVLGRVQEPNTPEPRKATAPQPKNGNETVEKAVSRLVEQLRQHPVKPSTAAKRLGLYMIDVENGDVTLIADQPDPGFV